MFDYDSMNGFEGFILRNVVFALIGGFAWFCGALITTAGLWGLLFVFSGFDDLLSDDRQQSIVMIGGVLLGGVVIGNLFYKSELEHKERRKLAIRTNESLQEKLDERDEEIERLKKRLELPPPLKAK